MKRDLSSELFRWKTNPFRVPLVIRGARQVGKSWIVKEFAKSFTNFVEINFEADKTAVSFFEGDLHIPDILTKLSLYKKEKIIPGETLLFFDEIQICPNCIQALRFFKEKRPDLHVIASGSLLDFILEQIGMPVGRVQYLYLYPLSFGEFLTATGNDDLRHALLENLELDRAFHPSLLDHLKNYLWLGGMPAVIDAWIQQKDAQLCQEIQDRIIIAYRDDFPKYAKKNQIEHINTLFEFIPANLGNKFKFSRVDTSLSAYTLKRALSLLIKAGIAHICNHSSGHKYPLGSEKNDNKFKIFFLDVGLAYRMLGLNLSEWIANPISTKTLGGIAEQFVAQEFIAYGDKNKPSSLFYWHREARSSNAEVDFLCVKDSHIIPVEVKSGSQGGMKSLHLFLENHPKSPYGLKISENYFAKQASLIEIPLYAIEAWLHALPTALKEL